MKQNQDVVIIKIDKTARYADTLINFLAFVTRPASYDLRFWQALTSWCGKNIFHVSHSGLPSVLALTGVDNDYVRDTFYLEGKTK